LEREQADALVCPRHHVFISHKQSIKPSVRGKVDRVMIQAFSRRAHPAKAVSPCGICGGQSGIGTGFSPQYFGFPLSISFHPCCIIRKHYKKKEPITFITGLSPQHPLRGPSPQKKKRYFDFTTGYESPKRRYRYSSALPLTSALDGAGWSTPRSGRFNPRKEIRYWLHRGLIGTRGRFGRVRIISTPRGLEPRTAQPVASSHTDWATPAHVTPSVATVMTWLVLAVHFSAW
jgi:hypothetical protein